jgi:hypothetical protein
MQGAHPQLGGLLSVRGHKCYPNLQRSAGIRESELIVLSNNWRVDTQPNYERYARAQTPAMDPSQHTVTVEDEAQALARRIRKNEGGQRQHDLGVLNAELRTLERNTANGYTGWGFRIQVIKRTLELVGPF